MWHSLTQPRVVSAPTAAGGRRAASGSVGEEANFGVTIDALGRSRILRTESLTAMCLLIIAACSLGFMLFYLRAVLIPFAIAVFLMYLLQPMVNYLCKPPRRWCDKCFKSRGEVCCEGMLRVTKSRTFSTVSEAEPLEPEGWQPPPKGWACLNAPLVPRWLAVILALGVMMTALVSLGVIVYGSVLNLKREMTKYEEEANALAERMDVFLEKFNYSMDNDFLPYVVNNLRNQVPRALKLALSSLEYFCLVAIFLVYLLISPVKPIKSSVWGTIDLHIRRYIRLKIMVGFLAGAVVAVVLWLLGVSIPHVFGLVTFGLHFVPNLGPLVATCLPMPLVILDPDLCTLYKVLAFVLPTLVHMVIGNFVEPFLFGESFELSPVVVLLSLAFWGSLWGIAGMILAVPLIVIARIVCEHLDHPYAKTFMDLLAGNVFESEECELNKGLNLAGGGMSGGVVDPWDGEYRQERLATEERRGRGRSTSDAGSKKADEEARNYGATSTGP